MQVRLDFLPNLDGVFIVDRTLTGPAPGVRFQPTPTNIGDPVLMPKRSAEMPPSCGKG